jgi:tetratricopeptide (TPR) repeat protein
VSGWAEFPNEAVERAEELARRALALDPTATSAYRLLAIVDLFRRHFDLALGQIDRALEINPSDAESYAWRGVILVFAGKSAEALSWLEGALRFDRANIRATLYIGMAYYFLGRYEDAVEALDRALARTPGRNTQLLAHPILAASYAETGRDQDAQGERVIITRLSPFFDAKRFAAQFGTQKAHDRILEGLRKAGFR